MKSGDVVWVVLGADTPLAAERHGEWQVLKCILLEPGRSMSRVCCDREGSIAVAPWVVFETQAAADAEAALRTLQSWRR